MAEEESASDSSLWWLGVLLSVVASICSNLGVNIQKFSMNREMTHSKEDQRGYLRQPRWMLGMLLVVLGSLGDWAALGFAAQSLITPVGGFTLVANSVFAKVGLKERMSRLDVSGTSLIVVGVIVTAAFASKEAKSFDLDDLIDLYLRPSFWVYEASVVVIVIALYVAVKCFETIDRKFGRESTEYLRVRPLHPIFLAALSGLIGAQSTLFAKSTAELFKLTFGGDNQFMEIGTWAITLAMFLTIVVQIHWLAMGLERFDAIIIVPVFQCFFITGSILSGASYFNEFAEMDILQIAMFCVGVLILLLGVVLLAQHKSHNAEEEKELIDHSQMDEEAPRKAEPHQLTESVTVTSEASSSFWRSFSVGDNSIFTWDDSGRDLFPPAYGEDEAFGEDRSDKDSTVDGGRKMSSDGVVGSRPCLFDTAEDFLVHQADKFGVTPGVATLVIWESLHKQDYAHLRPSAIDKINNYVVEPISGRRNRRRVIGSGGTKTRKRRSQSMGARRRRGFKGAETPERSQQQRVSIVRGAPATSVSSWSEQPLSRGLGLTEEDLEPGEQASTGTVSAALSSVVTGVSDLVSSVFQHTSLSDGRVELTEEEEATDLAFVSDPTDIREAESPLPAPPPLGGDLQQKSLARDNSANSGSSSTF